MLTYQFYDLLPGLDDNWQVVNATNYLLNTYTKTQNPLTN